jgi:pimeloyl-ACP methyl ester carboxylesterase
VTARWLVRFLLLVAGLSVAGLSALGGCSSGVVLPQRSAVPSPSPSAPPESPSPPQPVVRCGGPSASARMVAPQAVDGTALAGAELGSGTRGVLLVPELGSRSLCGWWEYAAYLAGRGYHVLLFDHRCVGFSRCPTSAGTRDGLMDDIQGSIAALRAAGARSVVLVGASQGACEVLIAGARRLAGVAGIVALSPDELGVALAGPPVATATQAAPALTLPVLVAVAPYDQDAPVADVQALYAAVAARDKHLAVVNEQPGVHGWDLVTAGPNGRPAFAATVESFLAAHLS